MSSMGARDLPRRPWFGWFKIWRLNRAVDYEGDRYEADTRYELVKDTLHRVQQDIEAHDIGHQLMMETNEHAISALKRLEAVERLAEDIGMTLPTYEEFSKARGLAEVEIFKQSELDRLKLKLQEKMDRLELDKESEKMRIGIEGALRYKYLDIEAQSRIVKMLCEAYENRYSIQFSGKPRVVIQDQLGAVNIHIRGLLEKLNGLLQGDNGEDEGRSLPNSDFRRIVGPDVAEGHE